MKKGTLLEANELSNQVYGYTNLNHKCIVRFLEHVGIDTLGRAMMKVRVLTCNGECYEGQIMELMVDCFHILKEKPIHYISNLEIKKYHESRR